MGIKIDLESFYLSYSNTLTQMSFSIEEFNRIQAEKFAKHLNKEQKIKEEEEAIQAETQREIDEKIRLEQEEIMLKEMQYREEFDNVLDQLDTVIIGIHDSTCIMEVGMNTFCFRTLLEKYQKFTDDVNLLPEMAERVMSMISAISENPNTNYNIANKDMNFEASKDITDNIKECLKLVHTDESSIGLQLMNTDNDEAFAQQLQADINRPVGFNQRNPRKRYQRNKITIDTSRRVPVQSDFLQISDADIDEMELLRMMKWESN